VKLENSAVWASSLRDIAEVYLVEMTLRLYFLIVKLMMGVRVKLMMGVRVMATYIFNKRF